MADRTTLLGLDDDELIRRLFEAAGELDLEDEPLDELFGALEELCERAWPETYRRRVLAEIAEEHPDDRAMRLREADAVLASIDSRAGFRPVAQELARGA